MRIESSDTSGWPRRFAIAFAIAWRTARAHPFIRSAITVRISSIFECGTSRPFRPVISASDQHLPPAAAQYVVTEEIQRHLSIFRETIESGRGGGIWISGTFGSGKSHLLKVLSEELAADSPGTSAESTVGTSELALRAALAPIAGPQNLVAFLNLGGNARQRDGHHAIVNCVLRAFNGACGFSSARPDVAQLERQLENRGLLESFERCFGERAGLPWSSARDAIDPFEDALGIALSSAMPDLSRAGALDWFRELRSGYSPSAAEVAALFEDRIVRSDRSRIFILLDEVGQFIGGESAHLLSLQSLIEEISSRCRGRAWIVLTSQDDLEGVLERAGGKLDLCRISARFSARIRLSSANIDEVLYARLLAKSSQGLEALSGWRSPAGESLSSLMAASPLISIAPDDRPLAWYPLSRAQIEILSRVHSWLNKAGGAAGASERSLLASVAAALPKIREGEIGALVPFDWYYETVREALPAEINEAVSAAERGARLSGFGLRVLRLIALSRAFGELVRATPAMLAELMRGHVLEDRLAAAELVRRELREIERAGSCIQLGDSFYFLALDEQRLQREIGEIAIARSDLYKLVNEMVFREVLKASQWARSQESGERRVRCSHSCDGAAWGRIGGALEISVATPLSSAFASLDDSRCILETHTRDLAVIRCELGEPTLAEIHLLAQTNALLTQGRAGKHAEVLSLQNAERHDRIVERLAESVLEAAVFVRGRRWSDGKAARAHERYRRLSRFMVSAAYPKLAMAGAPRAPLAAEREALIAGALAPHEPRVESELHGFLELSPSEAHSLEAVLARFRAKPYGWDAQDVLAALAGMSARGKLAISGVAAAERNPSALYEEEAQASGLSVRLRSALSPADLAEAKRSLEALLPAEGATLDSASQSPLDLERLLQRVRHRKLYLGFRRELLSARSFPGAEIIAEGERHLESLLRATGMDDLLTKLGGLSRSALDFAEDLRDVDNFLANQIPNWAALVSILRRYEQNGEHLPEQAASTAARASEIVGKERPFAFLHESNHLRARFDDLEAVALSDARERLRSAIGRARARLSGRRSGSTRNRLDEIERKGLEQASIDLIDLAAFRAEALAESGAAESASSRHPQQARNDTLPDALPSIE